MRVDDLRNFVAIIASGSIAAAAQKLGTSQPTLSKSLARLERAVSAPLVERHARGVRLTAAGRATIGYARNIDMDARDALVSVRNLRQGFSGRVSFGVGIGIPQLLIASSCGPLIASGQLSVEILGGMSDSLFEAVACGEVDFAVTGVRPREGVRLEWTSLFRDPMIAVAHRDHPLAGEIAVTWDRLSLETWIVANTGTITRSWFDRQFLDRGLAPPARIIGLRGHPHAYELGLAIGALLLVPKCTLQFAREFRDFVEIPQPDDWRSDRVVGILTRTGAPVDPAARKAIDSIEKQARIMFPGAVLM